MRIIGDTNIPFLSYRRIALVISAVVIVAGLAYEFLGHGLNLGIDFVGGTQVTVKFNQQPDLGELRSAIAELTAGSPLIQRFDEAEKHEVMIRVENPGGEEGDFTPPDPRSSAREVQLGSRRPVRSQHQRFPGAHKFHRRC